MPPVPRDQQKLPKKDRKALARELARIERERQALRRRHRRRMTWIGVGTTGVAAVVVVALAVHASVVAGRVGPLNMLSDGILVTGDGTNLTATRTAAIEADGDPVATAADRSTGKLDIVLYVDYRSPDAATFWAANGAAITSWVTQGQATFELHPLALLDGSTITPAPTAAATDAATDGTDGAAGATETQSPEPFESTGDYSVRAAGAVACVADIAPDSVLAVHDALVTADPGADGLDNAALVTLVQKAGATDDAVATCIKKGEFTDWAAQATTRAAHSVPFDAVGKVTTSPVVVVAGTQYTGDLGDATAFDQFMSDVYTQVAAQAATDDSTADPDAAATDEPTDGATDPAADPAAEPTTTP